MPAVQVADPAAERGEININIMDGRHQITTAQSAEVISAVLLSMPQLTVDWRGNGILPVDQVGKSDPMLARNERPHAIATPRIESLSPIASLPAGRPPRCWMVIFNRCAPSPLTAAYPPIAAVPRRCRPRQEWARSRLGHDAGWLSPIMNCRAPGL